MCLTSCDGRLKANNPLQPTPQRSKRVRGFPLSRARLSDSVMSQTPSVRMQR
jgi:hypothetical protein